MIRSSSIALILLTAAALCAVSVKAQSDKYDVRLVKIYVLDKSGTSWNDPGAFLGVRLDASKKESLEDTEISSGTASYSIGEDYKRYSLKIDPSGCVAEVPFVVYKTEDRPVNYEMTLLIKEGEKYIASPLSNRTIAVTRDAKAQKVSASIYRPLLTSDWLLYGAIILISLFFIYFVVFRWLFSLLLFNRNWPVSRAEYFTTSLGLLMLVGVFGLLLVIALPQTVVMWTILGILAFFWTGHAIAWALS